MLNVLEWTQSLDIWDQLILHPIAWENLSRESFEAGSVYERWDFFNSKGNSWVPCKYAKVDWGRVLINNGEVVR